MTEKIIYAGSMEFLAPQGQPPISDPSRPSHLKLAHLTSVPPFVTNFEEVLKRHLSFKKAALSNTDTREILTVRDLHWPNTKGLLFGLQNAPEGLTRDRVRRLYDVGIRLMTLAYDGPNEYGSGFASDGGLTNYGRNVLSWMAECGILIDVSHLNRKTARDIMDFIWKEELLVNPMASHSGCYSVFHHPRNFPDGLLQEIATLQGYIGIFTVNFYLGKRGGRYLNAFARHARRAVDMAGNKSVGIGSDGIHGDMTLATTRRHYGKMTKMLKTGGSFGKYFPDRPPILIKSGSWMFEILEEKLHESFSTTNVAGLCGQNFTDYLHRSLPQV